MGFCSYFHFQLIIYCLKLFNPAIPVESQSYNSVGLCFPLGLLVFSLCFQLFFSSGSKILILQSQPDLVVDCAGNFN